MEIAMGCGEASVFVMDSDGYEVVAFDGVKVKGETGLCGNTNGGTYVNPGIDLPKVRIGDRRK